MFHISHAMPCTITKCINIFLCEPFDLFKTLKQNSFYRNAICEYLFFTYNIVNIC